MLRVRKMIGSAALLVASACDSVHAVSVDGDAGGLGDTDAVTEAGPTVEAAWARALPVGADCLRTEAFADNRFVIVAGRFAGTVDFGDGARTSAANDLFALALDLAGGAPATRSFAGTSTACGGLAIDADGLLVLAGGFEGALTFGATTLQAPSASAYLASISLDAPLPGVRFARRFGPLSAGDGHLTLVQATVGRNGAATAAGYGDGAIDFGLGPTTGDAREVPAVVRVDKSGAPVFGRRFVGGPARALDIGVGANDASVVVGVAQGALDLGGGARPYGGGGGAFVAALDGAGGLVWDRTRGDGGSTTARAEAVATDLAGTAVVVGVEHVAAGDRAFAWKLDARGNTQWDRPIGGVGTTLGAVATDVSGNVFAGGAAAGPCSIDGVALAPVGAQDGLLVALDQAGRVRWARRVGGAGATTAITHVSVTRADALLVTGTFQGRVELLGRTLESAERRGFVLKIVP
jgi:hypothetical protein